KAYMEMDIPSLQSAGAALGASHPGTTAPSAEATVTKTGKHEKVAGYDCEDWDIKDPSGKRAQACMAEGIPFIAFSTIGPGQPTKSAWMQAVEEAKAFPLRVIEMDPAGKELSRIEVTKIEKKKLDDALFTIPAGYKKLEMPHFGGPGGLPGLPAPPHK